MRRGRPSMLPGGFCLDKRNASARPYRAKNTPAVARVERGSISSSLFSVSSALSPTAKHQLRPCPARFRNCRPGSSMSRPLGGGVTAIPAGVDESGDSWGTANSCGHSDTRRVPRRDTASTRLLRTENRTKGNAESPDIFPLQRDPRWQQPGFVGYTIGLCLYSGSTTYP
jgi:hypothetical protein